MAQKRRNGSHAHGRIRPSALQRTEEENKERIECLKLRAEFSTMTPISDLVRRDRSVYDALKLRRLYVLPGLTRQEADEYMRAGQLRVNEPGLGIY